MRVVVTGSRDWTDASAVTRQLAALPWSHRPPAPYGGDGDFVALGDCPTGVDAIALAWCKATGTPYARCLANWGRWGRAAGPLRNAQTLLVGQPVDVCMAFHPDLFGKSKGTLDMVRRCNRAGVPVRLYAR